MGGTSYLFLASICQIPGEGEPFALSLCISTKEEKKKTGRKEKCVLPFPLLVGSAGGLSSGVQERVSW